MPHSKSLSAEQNDFARKVVRGLIERKFGGDRSRAADAFGVSQPTVTEFLNGNKGMGSKLLLGVASVDQASSQAILSGRVVIDVEGSEIGERSMLTGTVAESPAVPGIAAEMMPPRTKLERIREQLYLMHGKLLVDQVIGGSDYVGLSDFNESKAFRELHQQIQKLDRAEHALGRREPISAPSSVPPARKRHEGKTKRLVKSSAAGRGKQAG